MHMVFIVYFKGDEFYYFFPNYMVYPLDDCLIMLQVNDS